MPKGGARKGAGRPFGARDKFPRNIGAQVHHMKAQAAEYYDRSEYVFTNEEKVFEGNHLKLIETFYKDERLPVQFRGFMAKTSAELELRFGVAGIAIDPVTGISYETKLLDQIERLTKEINTERDKQLHKLVEDGVISAEAAKAVWQIWIEDSEADWQFSPTAILKLPRPRTASQSVDSPDPMPNRSNSKEANTANSPQPPIGAKPALVEEVPKLWKQVAMEKATRVVFADPGVVFKIGDKRYGANALGEIEVSDFLDEAALLRVGCRAERQE